MLRRPTKQVLVVDSKQSVKRKTKTCVKKTSVLGCKKRKRKEEEVVLESLVLGGETEIIKRLETSNEVHLYLL